MNNGTVLEVRHLKKYFVKSAGILSALLGEKKRYVSAVADVSFSISKGQVFCVAGESGCGKTTLGRTILKLLQSDDGQIIFQGQDITRLKSDSMRMLRTKMQMIFQDPYESLDPRAKIYDSVAEPLMVNHLVEDEKEKRNKVIQTLELAGLTPVENYLYKYPHNLSGGERQRVGIATALVLDPEFIVADEPTSMLDVSVQANLLNLLQKLRQERNLTYLFITHDLSIAYAFSDRLAIMYLGKFVEMGPTAEVVMSPIHPYTKALISVVPGINLAKNQKPIILPGETPNPENVPAGCRFHPRCYCKVERCLTDEPAMMECSPQHYAACFVQEKMKLKEDRK